VAHRAGVSLTTASKAINGQNRVSEQTRARVLKAARDLAYSPNPMARSLISGRSGTVGVIVVDSLVHRFLVPIMLGAETALSEIDLSMVISDARGEPERLKALVGRMQHRKVDGVIVIGDNNVPTPSVTERLGLPVVYVYGETDRPTDVVHVPNDRGAAALLVRHLLDVGCREIAHLTGPRRTRAVVERARGVGDALREAGLRPAAPVRHGEWSQRWGRTAISALLPRVPDLDGIVAGSDQIAAGVVDGLVRSGVRVPDDVRIGSFDNWPIFALETEPPLTTMDMNLEALGAAAVQDLFAVIDGKRVGGGVRLHECSLVARGSTGR